MKPSATLRNFTPSSTGEVSGSSNTAGRESLLQMWQGHAGAGCPPSAAASTAPLSQATPCGRADPRWSTAGQSTPTAASRAGLPSSRPCVCVGPPLSASGPSRGSFPVVSLAVAPVRVQPVVLPMTLAPPELTVPPQSGAPPVASVLPPTTDAVSSVRPVPETPPPEPNPWYW